MTALRAAPWVLIALLAAALAWTHRERGRAEQRATDLEAQLLKAAGLDVIAQKKLTELRGDVARLEAGDAELHAALEEARRVAPSARPVSTAHMETPPIVVTVPADHAALAPSCALLASEQLRLYLDEVRLETDAGNRIAVALASAWRVAPGVPDALLGRERLRGPVEELHVPSAPATRWRCGAGALAASSGYAAALAVETPTVEALGLAVGAVGAVGFGHAGAQGALLVLGTLR